MGNKNENGNNHRKRREKGKEARELAELDELQETMQYLQNLNVPLPLRGLSVELNAAAGYNAEYLSCFDEKERISAAARLTKLIETNSGRFVQYESGEVQIQLEIVYVSAYTDDGTSTAKSNWEFYVWGIFSDQTGYNRKSQPIRLSMNNLKFIDGNRATHSLASNN